MPVEQQYQSQKLSYRFHEKTCPNWIVTRRASKPSNPNHKKRIIRANPNQKLQSGPQKCAHEQCAQNLLQTKIKPENPNSRKAFSFVFYQANYESTQHVQAQNRQVRDCSKLNASMRCERDWDLQTFSFLKEKWQSERES